MAQTFTSFQQDTNINDNCFIVVVDEENYWEDIEEYKEYIKFQNEYFEKEKELRSINTTNERPRKETFSFYSQPHDSPTKRRVINSLKYDKLWF